MCGQVGTLQVNWKGEETAGVNCELVEEVTGSQQYNIDISHLVRMEGFKAVW